MSRLSIMDRDQLPVAERRFYDAVKAIRRRPISGPFIVLLNSSPDLAARFAHLGHYFHARGQADESILSLRVRTFVALIGSRALDAPYEWGAWVEWALEAGVPRQTVDAIRENAALLELSAEEELVRDFCVQLASGEHHVSDALFDKARAHFGVQALTELVATLGYFAMIALPLNAFEMEMSRDQKSARKPFEPLTFERGSTAWRIGPASSKWPARASGARQPRLPQISAHADLPASHQHFFDRIVRAHGHISAPYRVLLNSPDAAERIGNVGQYFLYETKLAPMPRALVWLATARELDSDYAWAAAQVLARRAGLQPAQIEAIEHRAATRATSADERALVDFCHQLLRGNHHIDDAGYGAMVERFGLSTVVEASATVGYVAMMSIITNAFDLEPPAVDDELVL